MILYKNIYVLVTKRGVKREVLLLIHGVSLLSCQISQTSWARAPLSVSLIENDRYQFLQQLYRFHSKVTPVALLQSSAKSSVPFYQIAAKRFDVARAHHSF